MLLLVKLGVVLQHVIQEHVVRSAVGGYHRQRCDARECGVANCFSVSPRENNTKYDRVFAKISREDPCPRGLEDDVQRIASP